MQIAAWITLALGLIFAAIGFWFYRKVQRMKSWPAVDGTMLHGDVERSVSTDQDGNESVSYTLAVGYQYAVGGTKYTGSRIALANRGYGTRRGAEERLAAYRPGTVVRVMYDPEDPRSSVLETSGAVLGWVFIVIGGVMLVVAIIMVFLPAE